MTIFVIISINICFNLSKHLHRLTLEKSKALSDLAKVGLVSNIFDYIDFFSCVGTLEKYTEGKWRTVPPEDQLKLSKHDGQVWMALLNLLLKPDCQRKYDFNSFNKTQLLKVRFCTGAKIYIFFK